MVKILSPVPLARGTGIRTSSQSESRKCLWDRGSNLCTKLTESRASEKIGREENIGAGFRVPAVQSLGRKMRPLLGFSRHPAPAGEKILRKRWRREWDSNPRYGFPYTRFPSVRLQPLGHPSGRRDSRQVADYSEGMPAHKRVVDGTPAARQHRRRLNGGARRAMPGRSR